MSAQSKQEKIAEMTGIPTDTVNLILKDWHQMPAKKVIAAAIELSIEERRNKIENCKPEELANLQGEAKGLRIALGNLDVGIVKGNR